MSTVLPGSSRFAPVGTSSPTGARRRSVRVAPAAAASGASSGSSRMNSCRPFSIEIPLVTQSRSTRRHAGGKRPPCGRHADERDGRLERQRGRHVRDDRDPLLALPGARRVEDRDDVLAPVAQHAAHRLAVVRVAGEALGEDQQAPLRRAVSRHRGPAPPTGPASRPRTRRRGTDPRRSAGSRRGRRGRREGPRRSPPRFRGPTRPCSRA